MEELLNMVKKKEDDTANSATEGLMQNSEAHMMVVQSNEFVQSTSVGMMAQNQLKCLYFLISCVTQADSLLYPVRLSYKTICGILGIDYKKGGTKKYLTTMLLNMHSQSFYTRDEDGKMNVVPCFSYYQIDEEAGMATFLLNEYLNSSLLGLSKNFVQYQLASLLRLDSAYSIKLYNLLRSYAYRGKATLSILEIRRNLNLYNSEEKTNLYESGNDFIRKVLIPSIQEINVKTDITVKYTAKRARTDARKISSIAFDIATKERVEMSEPIFTYNILLSFANEQCNGLDVRIVDLVSEDYPQSYRMA